MIEYIFKSTICLVILLAVYHIFFENEKMHKFNRYFLLLGLALGLVIPFITLNSSIQPLEPVALNNFYQEPVITDHLPVNQPGNPAATANTLDTSLILAVIYSAGTLLLLIRFAINLIRILSSINRHQRIKTDQSVVILVNEKVLPHTFLKYIFFNEEEYKNRNIDDKLLTHELAHVQQKHSLDIILIELLQIVFWFNPVFIFYKKAIRLNHEFLADEAVVCAFDDVASYQQLLLDKMMFVQPVNLSSNLTYSLTKKRMIMMKKHTPKSRAIMKKIALAPLFALLIFLFSDKATALPGGKINAAHFTKKVGIDETETPKELYYKGATVKYKNKEGKYILKKYDDMTADEKNSMPLPFPPPTPKAPSEALLNEWKSSAKYGIWVNDKHITNKELDKYKATDFNFYWNSRLTKRAQNYGIRRFQIDLLTPDYYKQVYIDPRKVPGKKIVLFTTQKGQFAMPVPRFESDDKGLFESGK